jgi:hypothetical protein
MPGGFRYRSEFCQRSESFVFICGQRDVARQAEHLEKLNCLVINVREDELRASACGGVYYAEKNGNADAVDQCRLAEIDYQGTATRLKLTATLTLDAFAAQLV